MKGRDGGVELLTKVHLSQANPWGQPVVSWKPNSQGEGGLHNPNGFAMMRVVVWRMLGGRRRSLYDQPLIVENLGAIVIAECGDKIGLVRNFRMTGERLLPHAGANYIRRLDREKLWGKLADSLGTWSWEAPRGLVPSEGEEDMISFILRSAKLEATQETGFVIEEAEIVGQINVNPTFFAHPQYVVHAKIGTIGAAVPEKTEIVGPTRLFTREQLRELNTCGEFNDGLTLAGLALCGISI